jgi:hypothetical protein
MAYSTSADKPEEEEGGWSPPFSVAVLVVVGLLLLATKASMSSCAAWMRSPGSVETSFQ